MTEREEYLQLLLHQKLLELSEIKAAWMEYDKGSKYDKGSITRFMKIQNLCLGKGCNEP
jgi:hypothetical protein